MVTDKTLLSDVLTKDRLHEHLTEMTLIADRLLREEFRGSRRVRELSLIHI